MHSRLQHASIRILLYAGLASGLLAQTGTAPSGEPAAPSAAKAAPPSGSSPSAAIPGNDEAAVWTKKRQAKAATALQEANRLRTLYTEDPVSARAPETRRQEALALITQPKPFVIAVSDATRTYLEERFTFRAPERTTEEFLRELGGTDLLQPEQKESLGNFLASCDLVKFAKYEPGEKELHELHGSAVRLVEETEPEENAESGNETHRETK